MCLSHESILLLLFLLTLQQQHDRPQPVPLRLPSERQVVGPHVEVEAILTHGLADGAAPRWLRTRWTKLEGGVSTLKERGKKLDMILGGLY